MKRRLPPLKALPAFEVAARLLSFTAAAEDLHLTHGAISRQVKALESYLGTVLFRRLNRQIELTEAGAALLPSVRAALDIIETSAAQISALPQQGPLVVSCLPTLMMRWLIPRLYDFNARYPHIEVRFAASYAPVNFSRDGVDVAIRFGSPPWPESIEAHVFLEEEVGPVCNPALLERYELKRPADLRHHTLLHTDSRPDAWAHWISQNGVEGINITDGQRFEHFYFLIEAAVSGLGVAVAPLPLVSDDLKTGRLVAPFEFIPSGRSYYILHLKEFSGIPKIKAFRSWIIDVASGQTFGLSKPQRSSESRME